MPIEESSAAIVLRARDYSESDRIVTLLTRDFGKLWEFFPSIPSISERAS